MEKGIFYHGKEKRDMKIEEHRDVILRKRIERRNLETEM